MPGVIHRLALSRASPRYVSLLRVFMLCVLLLHWAGPALLAPLSLAQSSPTATREPRIQPLDMTLISPGVYGHAGSIEVWNRGNQGDIANLSFVVGEHCIAVIDTGSTLMIGLRLRAAIEQLGAGKPVCYVINTHAHPDHQFGNAAFADTDARFIAHAKMARAQATRGQAYLGALQRELGELADGTTQVAPTREVHGSLELDLGGRRLTVRAHETAHTDADLSVWDAAAGILWLGDLAFVGHLPVVDGNLNNWIALLQRFRTLPVRIAIPGHGSWVEPGWPQLLDDQQHYLLALRSSVREAISGGQSLSQALASNRVGQYSRWQLYGEFHQRNVSAAYAELEWE
jgi:quinoprotein relay system zinc metallohydrolase 2